MKEFKIRLTVVDDVKDFCVICQDLNKDIDVRSGKYLVDAKSLLGLFSLKLSEPVTVSCSEADYKAVTEAVSRFMI